MAKYTIELRQILKSNIDIGLGPNDYPIFDESYRVTFNDKLLKHYMFNEIGSETADRFVYYLNRTLNEIMPYYNKLYVAELKEFDFLIDFKKTVTGSKVIDIDVKQNIDNETTIESETSQNSTTETDSTANKSDNSNTQNGATVLNIGSETPQSQLLLGNIEENLYADKANVTKDNSSVAFIANSDTNSNQTVEDRTKNSVESDSASSTINKTDSETTESHNMSEEGFNTSQSELLMKYRETLINIDMMVIEDPRIKACFMLVY